MKNYTPPQLDVIWLNPVDVIAASGGVETDDMPV